MIFTYVWAFGHPEDERAVHQLAQPIRRRGGRVVKVGVGEYLFRNEKGDPVSSSADYRVWREAGSLTLTPRQVESPLAARPYDLRHAAVSLWLNAGVSAPEVAERARHSGKPVRQLAPGLGIAPGGNVA